VDFLTEISVEFDLGELQWLMHEHAATCDRNTPTPLAGAWLKVH
jgi:hypothetical protein